MATELLKTQRVSLLNQTAIWHILSKCMKSLHESGDVINEVALMSLVQAMGVLFGKSLNFVMMEGRVEQEPVDCTGLLGKVKVFLLRPYKRRDASVGKRTVEHGKRVGDKQAFCSAVIVVPESLSDIAGLLRVGDQVKVMGSLNRCHRYSVNNHVGKTFKPYGLTFKFEVLASGMELVYEKRMHKHIAPGSHKWAISPDRESRGVL